MTALHQLREHCLHTVTRVEINWAKYGPALRQLREDSGLLRAEMAAKLGISDETLSDVEAGADGLSLYQQICFINHCNT